MTTKSDIERERAGLERIVEANRETIVALREVAEKFARERNSYADSLTEALKLRDELRGALRVAHEALGCWGVHDPGCPGRNEGDDYCSCGLGEVRGVVTKAVSR